MNYIKIINWFWEEAPYIKGFKVQYGFLFLAILDSINRNHWAPWTRIAYDNIINKCPFGKRLYLEGRQWLIAQYFIEMVPGKNAYQMVSFGLGEAVQKCTTIEPTEDTTIEPTEDTTVAPLQAPLQAPIIKHKTNKPLKQKTEKQINIDFEIFWNLYDKKVGNKVKIESLWEKLTDDERSLAINHIVPYKNSQPNKQYRKNPETYLRNKSFNDEIIDSNGNTAKPSLPKFGSNKQQAVTDLIGDFVELRKLEAV